MNKKQYGEMVRLKTLVHGTFGVAKHPSVSKSEQEKLYEQYIKLRRMYSECKGKIKDE